MWCARPQTVDADDAINTLASARLREQLRAPWTPDQSGSYNGLWVGSLNLLIKSINSRYQNYNLRIVIDVRTPSLSCRCQHAQVLGGCRWLRSRGVLSRSLTNVADTLLYF